jgi:hypothetical protein
VTLPLPGATVELIEREQSCYAILHWGGMVRFLPMTHAEYATYAAIWKEFEDVAAAERRNSEHTRAGRESILAARRGRRASAATA